MVFQSPSEFIFTYNYQYLYTISKGSKKFTDNSKDEAGSIRHLVDEADYNKSRPPDRWVSLAFDIWVVCSFYFTFTCKFSAETSFRLHLLKVLLDNCNFI